MVVGSIKYVPASELTADIVPDDFFQMVEEIAPFTFQNGIALVSFDALMEHAVAAQALTSDEERWLQNRCNKFESSHVHYVDIRS